MDTYIFYRSFHEALSELDIKEYGKIMYAINEYALNQNEEKVNALTGITKALWTLIKPQIDANLRRREIGSRNAEYGKLGGRPRKEKTPMGFSTETPNVNVNVNKNLNTNKNVNVNGETVTNTSTVTTPTLNDVKEFIKEQGLTVSAAKFFAHYNVKNWKGVNNWQEALLHWEENQFVKSTDKKSSEKNADNNYCRDAKEVLAELEK